MFRRNRPTVAATAETPSWNVYQRAHDGNVMYARFNSALARAGDLAGYPVQIGVALPLNEPDDRGLPQADEMEELDGIEELIVRMVGTQAVMVGVITTASMREFVFYARGGGWIEQFHLDLQQAVQSHRVDVMARTDPAWSVYRSFVSG